MNTREAANYKATRDALRKRFEDEKTGEQSIYESVSRHYKPLIDTQKQSTKTIQDQLRQNTGAMSEVLVPFVQQLQKRQDLQDTLQGLPFYPPGVEYQSTPRKRVVDVDFDAGLNESDIENLHNMSLDRPSNVYRKGVDLDDILDRIKSENKSNGQSNKQRHPELYQSIKGMLKKN